MKKKVNKFIYWTPRILSIIFILFLALFSLDVFGENYGFWGTIVGLFMHNIPSLVLLIVLLIAWKHEIVGGVAFILAGLFYCAAMGTALSRSQSPEGIISSGMLIIAGPAFIIGILFLINWYKKKGA